PLGVHLRQVVREDKAGARTVSAANHGDRCVLQWYARVQGGQGGIVPLGDLAQVDVTEDMARELDLPGLDALDVDHGHDAANDARKLNQAVLGQFVVLERHVGRTEI